MNSIPFFVSPIWLLIATLVLFLLSKKSAREIFGAFELNSAVRTGLFVFIQLLVMSVALEMGSNHFGLNDLESVEAFSKNIAAQGVYGGLSMGVSAFIEELFFRGIFLSLAGPWASVALFGFAHAGYGSLIQLIGAFLAGIILLHARRSTNSVFPGFVGHFLYNIVAVFILT